MATQSGLLMAESGSDTTMNFSLTEEQALLQDSIEKYVRDNGDAERHRKLSQTELGFDAEAWGQYAELGWLCMPFAEEQGGFGGGAVDIMVMTQTMGKGLLREPFLTTVVTCGGFLQQAGNTEQQEQFIPAIIEGQSQWAFAFAELSSGYDFAAVDTKVEGGTLSGSKLAVLNGHCADYFIVSAKTAEGLSLFIVDGSSDGITKEPFHAVDGSCGANIEFNNVPAQLLGEAGQAEAIIEKVLMNTIVGMGGEALGAMEVLLAATVEYSKTREQFGQPIGKFQALQHRMADMFLKVEETKSLLYNAAILIDEQSDEAMQACAALKVKIAEAGRLVSQEAVQIHGGIGMTDELDVSHHFKRLMLLAMLYGDEDYYLQRYIKLAA